MQPLALPPAQVCIPGDPLMDLCEGKECVDMGADEDGDLRRLQWEYGKLRNRWRALLAAQEERATLIHKVLSEIGSQPVSPSSEVVGAGDASPLSKELVKTTRGNHLLEAYLRWKVLEPLFWRWMESVIDSQSTDPCEEDSAQTPGGPQMPVAPGRCSSGDRVGRMREHLGALRPQTQASLGARRDGSASRRDGSASRRGLSRQQGKHNSTNPGLVPAQLLEEERRVASRLHVLSASFTPTSVDNGFIPCLHFQGRPAHRPHHEPHKHSSLEAGPPAPLQASEVIQELRAREASLLRKLEEARRAQREALQERANGLEGVIFIPPPKRCHTPP
ncbi:tubulin epsilon and delta complex protein 1 isoform X1 [Clupea harengus]|uniref:Tubulin epsilon and delta complex protein 1 isoform X1 n=1 Tax=Clupea harengus TaxID=7950 RepID=A0A6P3VNV7_CLUHA|nr:tubulin epsilon and delta complex protein 1 isoform X1 [Clupea harengus]